MNARGRLNVRKTMWRVRPSTTSVKKDIDLGFSLLFTMMDLFAIAALLKSYSETRAWGATLVSSTWVNFAAFLAID